MIEEASNHWWTIAIAAYAAIVATGALFLEVRRWFESGPRLALVVSPEMEAINLPGTEGKTYVTVQVSNRGQLPTTISHFAFYDYENGFNRFRGKQQWSAIVPNPQPPGSSPILPSVLNPGETWYGMAAHDENLVTRIKAGWLYVAIYASHIDKPKLKRVRPPAEPQSS